MRTQIEISQLKNAVPEILKDLVGKLNSRVEVTEEQINDTADNNRNCPINNIDNVY